MDSSKLSYQLFQCDGLKVFSAWVVSGNGNHWLKRDTAYIVCQVFLTRRCCTSADGSSMMPPALEFPTEAGRGEKRCGGCTHGSPSGLRHSAFSTQEHVTYWETSNEGRNLQSLGWAPWQVILQQWKLFSFIYFNVFVHFYSFILEDDLISIVAPMGAIAQDQATGAAYS